MLCENRLPKYFWAETVNTACYITNRALIRPLLKKTPYELYRGKKPNVEHFRVFDYRCFVLNNGKDHLGKFDSKVDEGIFLGYDSNSTSYKTFNKKTLIVEISVHVTFDESNLLKAENDSASDVDRITTELEDLDLLKDDETIPKPTTVEQDAPEAAEELPKERRWTKYHSASNIIENPDQGMTTRRRF